jgi:hypothetical protein
MKSFLISILLLAVVSSSAFGSDRKLQEWLSTGSWSQGVEYCNRKLADDVSRQSDLRSVSTEYLSRLAVYCAALASGKGDELSSNWWWYTAASIDLEAAQSLLPELRKMGLLQTLPAPRSRGPLSAREASEEKMVRLLSGDIVPGTPPRLLNKPRMSSYMLRPITGVAGATVTVEVVVSRDGVPQQPLLVDAHALPVHVLFAYRYLSTWRFEPAKVNDEPVACFYTATVHIQYGK